MMEWRQISGYEFIYSISENGDIRSEYAGTGSSKSGILKIGVDNHGYPRVGLTKNGTQKGYRLSALVAAVFIGVRPEGYDIDHIDGNKLNNHYRNLEYVTRKENIIRSHKLGLQRPPKGSDHWKSKINEDTIKAIRREYIPRVVSFAMLANRYSTSRSAIQQIIERKTWAHVKD